MEHKAWNGSQCEQGPVEPTASGDATADPLTPTVSQGTDTLTPTVNQGVDTSDLEVVDIEEGIDTLHFGEQRSGTTEGDYGSIENGMGELSLGEANETRTTVPDVKQNYTYPHKSSELLRQLNNLRLAKKLVDVILVSSDGEEFCCHRAVLAASSQYFGAMFTDDLLESHVERVELTNIKARTLSTILDAVYLCEVEIQCETVQDLLASAHFLNYPHILESCCQFLHDSLSPLNCLGISQLAETYSCHNLQNQAWNFTLANFNDVSRGQEFVELSPTELERIVSSDDVNVDNEDQILAAVLHWVNNNDKHSAAFPSVLACVRLPLVRDDNLTGVSATNRVLRSCEKCKMLIKEAQNLKELARKGKQMDHPLLQPRHAMRSEVLVVVGGMIASREWVPHVACLNPKTDEWTSMAELPFSYSDYSVASVDDAIYVTGGFHREKGTIGDVWRYDEMHDKWSRVSALTKPRFNHSSIGYEHHIYVIGGEDCDKRLVEIEKYSPGSDEWEIIGSINPTASGLAAVGLHDKLYVIGWLTNVRLMCVVQCFDLETRECTTIPSSGLNRQLFSAAALGDHIFILGGNRIKEVAMYDPTNFTSRKVEPMRYKRNTPSAAVVGRKIYVTGGELRQYVDKVEWYDPEVDLWYAAAPMPNAVCFHGCVMIKKYLGPPYH